MSSTGRVPLGQALVASDEARSGLHPSGFDPSRRGLPCACGREAVPKRDHPSIRLIKRAARDTPGALAYIEELEALWAYAERQGNVWRGIAAAMGYEPRAHLSVRPTSQWLIERVERFRAAREGDAQ